MIINGCDSFLLIGDRESDKWKHGILLVHGFTATPAEMRPLGEYLNKLGYSVVCMRLAGHSTTPQDMARTTWKDWFNSASDGYSILASFCEKISVVGQSMGGLLSLLLCTCADIEKMAVLAVPILIQNERQLDLLPPREQCAGRFHHKKRRQMQGVPDACNISYAEMPLIAVHELLELMEEVKLNLNRITLPALIIQSNNDHTVNPKSADYIYKNIASVNKDLIWLEKSGHLLSIGIEKEYVFEKVAKFLTEE